MNAARARRGQGLEARQGLHADFHTLLLLWNRDNLVARRAIQGTPQNLPLTLGACLPEPVGQWKKQD